MFDLALNLTLREDDQAIIREIETTLNCGHIYYISYQRERNKGIASCNQWKWIVTKIPDIVNIIISILDCYPLRTKKAQDYELWREAVFILYSKDHRSDNGQRILKNLNFELSKLRHNLFDELGYSRRKA
jgi:hypothetical protein